MNSQYKIILDMLSDLSWHCTSEMRGEYMADPPKRLQELRDEKHYQFYEPRLCKRHNHKGGVKEWRLISLMVSQDREKTPSTDKVTVSEKSLRINDSVTVQQIPFPSGNYAYYPPPPPTYCCDVYRLSIERHFKPWHSKGCETQKQLT